jgi:hypothetical protein
MGEATPPQPAAGWYPDPSGIPGQQRYFDGVNWGPTAPPPPPGSGSGAVAAYPPTGPYGNVVTDQPRFTIHYGFALLAILSLLGTIVFAIPLFSAAGSTDDEGAAGIGAGMGILWLLWGGMWTLIWTAFAIQHTLRGRRK